MSKLSREEAARVLMDALRPLHMPFPYHGGWSQILADLACLDRQTIRNYACRQRKNVTAKR